MSILISRLAYLFLAIKDPGMHFIGFFLTSGFTALNILSPLLLMQLLYARMQLLHGVHFTLWRGKALNGQCGPACLLQVLVHPSDCAWCNFSNIRFYLRFEKKKKKKKKQ